MTTQNRTGIRYKLNPSHCSCCSRPLEDPTSVEFGIGPVCRAKYNYEDAYPIDMATSQKLVTLLKGMGATDVADEATTYVIKDDSRMAARTLNIALAVWRKQNTNREDAVIAIEALTLMGYTLLAGKIGKKLAEVIIEVTEDKRLALTTPYSEAFVAAVRNIQGRKWDGDNKVWTVPTKAKQAVWEALKASYPGSLGHGPQGMFLVA